MNLDLLTKILLLAVGALLGFISSLALDFIKRRREPRRQLAYAIEARPIAPDLAAGDLSPSLRLVYDNEQVKQLHLVTCHLANSGNQLLIDQFVRFEFAEHLRVRHGGFVKKPDPEMSALFRADSSVWSHGADTHRIQFKFGFLNPNDGVEIFVLVEGDVYSKPVLKNFNQSGSPELIETGAQKVRDERDRVVSLVQIIALLSAIGALFRFVEIGFHFDSIFTGVSFVLVAREAKSLISLFFTPRPTSVGSSVQIDVGEMKVEGNSIGINAKDRSDK